MDIYKEILGSEAATNVILGAEVFSAVQKYISALDVSRDAQSKLEDAKRAESESYRGLAKLLETQVNPVLETTGIRQVGTSDAEVRQFATGLVAYLFEKRQR